MDVLKKEHIKQLLPHRIRKVTGNILHINRTITAISKSLPNFIIIGSMKAGTTSLYDYLTQHPQIIPASKKEIHFFSNNFEMGKLWYQSHFPPKSKIGGKIITGEASPYYLFNPFAPKRIHRLLPNVKLIALFRNPVDRAISHYFHEVRAKRETMSLEEAMVTEEKRIEEDFTRMMKNEYYHGNIYQHFSYKRRGIYVDQLRSYMNYFRRDRVLILCSEELFENPEEVIREVFTFLGVDNEFRPPDLGAKHVGDYGDEISVGIRNYLIDFFMPHNQRLHEYLGRDFGW